MTKQRGLVLPLLAAAAIAGCDGEDTTGLNQLDPTAARANTEALEAVLANPVWQSVASLAARVPGGSQAAAALLVPEQLDDAVVSVAGARNAAAAVAEPLLALGPSAAPRIPSEIRGITFVLDLTTLQYVPDPARTGAPANGVRFILYAVNPLTHEPVPSAEIGYADLTDLGDSSPSGVALRLQVVSGGTTFLDYTVTAAGSENAGQVTATGFVADREIRVEFDIAVNASRNGLEERVTVEFDIAIPSRGFAAEARVESVKSAGSESGQVELNVRIGENTFTLSAQGGTDAIDATIRVNGNLFATIRGPASHPEIRGANGQPLSADEQQMLHALLELMGRVLELFGNLMAPAAAILGFGS